MPLELVLDHAIMERTQEVEVAATTIALDPQRTLKSVASENVLVRHNIIL